MGLGAMMSGKRSDVFGLCQSRGARQPNEDLAVEARHRSWQNRVYLTNFFNVKRNGQDMA